MAAAVAAGGGSQPPLAALTEHADSVMHCAATGSTIVSCSMDASVKFWNWDGSAGRLDHSNYDFVKAVTSVRTATVQGREVRSGAFFEIKLLKNSDTLIL